MSDLLEAKVLGAFEAQDVPNKSELQRKFGVGRRRVDKVTSEGFIPGLKRHKRGPPTHVVKRRQLLRKLHRMETVDAAGRRSKTYSSAPALQRPRAAARPSQHLQLHSVALDSPP